MNKKWIIVTRLINPITALFSYIFWSIWSLIFLFSLNPDLDKQVAWWPILTWMRRKQACEILHFPSIWFFTSHFDSGLCVSDFSPTSCYSPKQYYEKYALSSYNIGERENRLYSMVSLDKLWGSSPQPPQIPRASRKTWEFRSQFTMTNAALL